ncbi:MAG: hypothetical protein H6Q43_2960, partial [Deltaproteobacteria bacterium]|nr:hypothetical protein [Deltaproteobacteria bacterium]
LQGGSAREALSSFILSPDFNLVFGRLRIQVNSKQSFIKFSVCIQDERDLSFEKLSFYGF